MPLSFKSENYGNIAFGFFNIESDMLLLENHFFFADVFCTLIADAASRLSNETGNLHDPGQKEPEFELKVYHIADPCDIGDLMGAIHGVRFTGFIGETYKEFPFPENPRDFKQNPEGFRTGKLIKALIKRFAKETEILVKFTDDGHVSINSYVFDIKVFHELLLYVDQGGYPRWKNETRPGYVMAMKDSIQKSSNRFFQDLCM
ncbi:MAG: hypothetical protein GY857_10550 [Desulfobacula sp.]|nr:hypothetical protein [Desulfobacula sp.]